MILSGLPALALLSLLFLAPPLCFRWARARRSRHCWGLAGVCLGLIVSPASRGLYALGFLVPVPLLNLVPVLLGLGLSWFHGSPGFKLLTLLGGRHAGVVAPLQTLQIDLINGFVWALAYGMVGLGLDLCVNEKSEKSLHPAQQDSARPAGS